MIASRPNDALTAAPTAISPQNHQGGRGSAPTGIPAMMAVTSMTPATSPNDGQVGSTTVISPSTNTPISLVPAHSR
ncbi:Uncharacterised protein [Mycobacteroides abscessus subsp. abscessus]|nr:Uncharacterised protein [Mycobacteroides abscessus subsp. abscessus]